MRIDALTGQTFTLTKQFAPDGTVADVGAVTYTVVDGGGTSIDSGTATKSGSGTSTSYAVSVSALSAPDVLKVTWTSDTPVISVVDYVDVTRNALFTEAEARAYKGSGQQAPFASTSAWTDAALAEWRLRITDEFERITGRSWVRRYCRGEGPGTGGYTLPLNTLERTTADGANVGGRGSVRTARKIISVTVNGTAVAAANFKVRNGIIYRTDGVFDAASATDPFNVVVEWEYGDDPVDSEASLNALRMLSANAVVGNVSQYATSYSNEDGNQSFTQDGWAYPPKVWSWIKSTDRKLGIA